jgi:hypothetical protein
MYTALVVNGHNVHINAPYGEINMSDGKLNASVADIEKVRDLFGLAHDLIAQSSYPGHLSPKVVETMQFLAYQYGDFKTRAEALAKAAANSVDVEATKTLTADTIAAQAVPGSEAAR